MLAVLAFAAVAGIAPAAGPEEEVLALERQAMEGWLKGDSGPQLAVTDPGITLIHTVLEKRLEGIAALRDLYAQYGGMPLFDGYEMLEPKVQLAGDVAVLTYRLVQHRGGVTRYWNGTQVYWKKAEGWRVIHSHWSAAKEQQP
jgi:hypothetical protein